MGRLLRTSGYLTVRVSFAKMFQIDRSLLFLLLWILVPLQAQENVQVFNGGGELPSLSVSSVDENQSNILLENGGEIVLDTGFLKERKKNSDEEILWRQTAPFVPDTIEEHTNMIDWCRERGLTDQANLHAARIIELDPENETAHKVLGHVKLDGLWMTPTERREQLGYTSFGGRSVTYQEAELLQEEQNYKKQENRWKKQLKGMLSGIRERDQQTLELLRQIRDPSALRGLTDLLRKEPDPQTRILIVQCMGQLGSSAALGDLASVAIIDDDYDVRRTALEQISTVPKAVPGAVQFFRQRLYDPDNEKINRAAAALAALDAGETIPDLMNSLITRHQRTIVEGADQPTASFSNKGFTFNPAGAVTKTVTDTLQNSDVLAALQYLSNRHLPPGVDFGYDIDAWKEWYFHRKELDRFDTRRSE